MVPRIGSRGPAVARRADGAFDFGWGRACGFPEGSFSLAVGFPASEGFAGAAWSSSFVMFAHFDQFGARPPPLLDGLVVKSRAAAGRVSIRLWAATFCSKIRWPVLWRREGSFRRS